MGEKNVSWEIVKIAGKWAFFMQLAIVLCTLGLQLIQAGDYIYGGILIALGLLSAVVAAYLYGKGLAVYVVKMAHDHVMNSLKYAESMEIYNMSVLGSGISQTLTRGRW